MTQLCNHKFLMSKASVVLLPLFFLCLGGACNTHGHSNSEAVNDSIAEDNQVYGLVASVVAGRIDTLWVAPEKEYTVYEEHVDTLKSSWNDLPPLPIRDGVATASILNLGDLDGDGTDEIGMFKSYHSNWHLLHVLSVKHRKWTLLRDCQVVHLGMYLDEQFPLASPAGNGKIKLTRCIMSDVDIVVSDTIVNPVFESIDGIL